MRAYLEQLIAGRVEFTVKVALNVGGVLEERKLVALDDVGLALEWDEYPDVVELVPWSSIGFIEITINREEEET